MRKDIELTHKGDWSIDNMTGKQGKVVSLPCGMLI